MNTHAKKEKTTQQISTKKAKKATHKHPKKTF